MYIYETLSLIELGPQIFIVLFCFVLFFWNFVWDVRVVVGNIFNWGVVWFGKKPGFYRNNVRYYGISVRRPLTLKHQLPLSFPTCYKLNYLITPFFIAPSTIYILRTLGWKEEIQEIK